MWNNLSRRIGFGASDLIGKCNFLKAESDLQQQIESTIFLIIFSEKFPWVIMLTELFNLLRRKFIFQIFQHRIRGKQHVHNAFAVRRRPIFHLFSASTFAQLLDWPLAFSHSKGKLIFPQRAFSFLPGRIGKGRGKKLLK
jgi:hypothetical protein